MINIAVHFPACESLLRLVSSHQTALLRLPILRCYPDPNPVSYSQIFASCPFNFGELLSGRRRRRDLPGVVASIRESLEGRPLEQNPGSDFYRYQFLVLHQVVQRPKRDIQCGRCWLSSN
jgi:hypothetical protein